ncbi:hypothetical protein BDR04DRAFT_1168123 [Suillus decipiens]|nr:hypothetical protein BDR04DRAFT_1168123 [Suillus decipiens]
MNLLCWQAIIHTMFPDLCNIPQSLSKAARAKLLNNVRPLESGEAYNQGGKDLAPSVEGLGKQKDPNSKPEIPDGDYDHQLITDCAKSYFCNIHKQYLESIDDIKSKKAEEHKNNWRQCGQCATATKTRRKAAAAFQKATGHEGVMAMPDTDFASDVLTCKSGDVSADTINRWKDAEAGKGAWMVKGAQWRSPDVSFEVNFKY